jgi:hypothetical protein
MAVAAIRMDVVAITRPMRRETPGRDATSDVIKARAQSSATPKSFGAPA